MTRISLLVFLLPMILAASALPSWGQGGMARNIPDEDKIVDTEDDVLVVTVASVSNHKATRANPPHVVLDVEETIRGPKHKQLQAHWESPYDSESDIPDGPEITPKMRAELRQFAAEPLDNPKVGEKWVLIGFNPIDDDGNEQVNSLVISARFPLSTERRRWADAQLKRRKQYDAERNQYREQWRTGYASGGRPVEMGTELRPGMQVICTVGSAWPCSVIEVLDKGQVKVRGNGTDSRRDQVVSRDKLLLYPTDESKSK